MQAMFSKTIITESDIVLFAGVSGDNNALHVNEVGLAQVLDQHAPAREQLHQPGNDADTVGAANVVAALEKHMPRLGEGFVIAPLLRQLAGEGKRFTG